MTSFSEIVAFFRKLLDLIERKLRGVAQESEQAKHDQLENNPADFYNDHFGGLRGPDASPTSKQADAKGDQAT